MGESLDVNDTQQILQNRAALFGRFLGRRLESVRDLSPAFAQALLLPQTDGSGQQRQSLGERLGISDGLMEALHQNRIPLIGLLTPELFQTIIESVRIEDNSTLISIANRDNPLLTQFGDLCRVVGLEVMEIGDISQLASITSGPNDLQGEGARTIWLVPSKIPQGIVEQGQGLVEASEGSAVYLMFIGPLPEIPGIEEVTRGVIPVSEP